MTWSLTRDPTPCFKEMVQSSGFELRIQVPWLWHPTCAKDVKPENGSSCHDHDNVRVHVCSLHLFIPFPLSNTSGSVFNWTWRYKYVLYTRIILCTAGISRGWLVNGLLCAISMWSVGHWKDSQILWKFKGCLSDDCVGLAHIEFEASSTWCRKHLKRSCAKSLTCLALIFLTSNDVE